MTKLMLKTGADADFFKRGRRLAKAADQGGRLPAQRILSFEDPADLLELLTTARLALMRAVLEVPGSIAELAAHLNRDRRAVKRDVDVLASAGLVTITERIRPGHDRAKEVRAIARRIRLRATIG